MTEKMNSMTKMEEENDIQELMDDAPILKEKMIVDFVNGLEVSRDHIQVRSQRSGLFQRFFDSMTGRSFQRQQQIDQQFQHALETVQEWLTKIQYNQLQTTRAVDTVATKLYETRQSVMKLVDSHIQLRDTVIDIDQRLDNLAKVTKQKHDFLEEEIKSIGLRQSAKISMDKIFDQWEAGSKFKSFSPFVQLILVMESLYWSPFGQYDKQNPEFRDQIVDKCTIQLNRLTGFSGQKIMPIETFLEMMADGSKLNRETVIYLLQDSKEEQPLSTSLYEAARLNESYQLSSSVPRILSTSRFSDRFMQETGMRLYG